LLRGVRGLLALLVPPAAVLLGLLLVLSVGRI
jgi:hypothetical protein